MIQHGRGLVYGITYLPFCEHVVRIIPLTKLSPAVVTTTPQAICQGSWPETLLGVINIRVTIHGA